MKKFDIILFGATGFAGQHCILEIVRILSETGNKKFSWAVAGRNLDKLHQVLQVISNESGIPLNQIDCIVADVSDYQSLCTMTSQCRLLINSVGPFAKYGEDVIRACIESGTHHIDISAENQFLAMMQLKYHEVAKEKGVYVVGSCGFSSMLVECGIKYLRDHFDGELNSVVSYLHIGDLDQFRSTKVHYGTWVSIVHSFAEFRKLRPIIKKLYRLEPPKPKFPLVKRLLHWNSFGEEDGPNPSLPFPSPDIWTVERTQNYMFIHQDEKPVQYFPYLQISGLLFAILLLIWTFFVGILTQFGFGVHLLEEYPEFFSTGFISRKGPTKEQRENFKFTLSLIGEGWERNEGLSTRTRGPPNKSLAIVVKGSDPAVGTTNVCFVQAALTILNEPDKLPDSGGVYTPGMAFENTSIIEGLGKHGLEFRILGSKCLP